VLDALTIDQVAPGEQQPESDHFFKAEGADAGVNKGKHWRHATGWFSYDLTDKKSEARAAADIFKSRRRPPLRYLNQWPTAG
jgi:hypothetical protein